MPDSTSIPAFIPLSLMEALRNLDTPVDDGLLEVSQEIVTKRLGLSSTVAAQIARYRDLAQRGEAVSRDEAISVFRLVGRRVDAHLVFADGGRRAARYAAGSSRLPLSTLGPASTSSITGRVRGRKVVKVGNSAFEADVKFSAGVPEIRMPAPMSIDALPEGQGCRFYGAAFSELLRCVTGYEGALVHHACRARGDDGCGWRGAETEDYS